MNVMVWLVQPAQIPPPDGPERVELLVRRTAVGLPPLSRGDVVQYGGHRYPVKRVEWQLAEDDELEDTETVHYVVGQPRRPDRLDVPPFYDPGNPEALT